MKLHNLIRGLWLHVLPHTQISAYNIYGCIWKQMYTRVTYNEKVEIGDKGQIAGNGHLVHRREYNANCFSIFNSDRSLNFWW